MEVARQLHRAICGPTVFPRGREKEKGPNEGQLLFFLRRRQLANNNGSPSQGQSIQHEACIDAEVSMLPTAAAEWHAAEGCCTLAESTKLLDPKWLRTSFVTFLIDTPLSPGLGVHGPRGPHTSSHSLWLPALDDCVPCVFALGSEGKGQAHTQSALESIKRRRVYRRPSWGRLLMRPRRLV